MSKVKMATITSIVAVACLLLPAAAAGERLPLVATPEHYALTLAPDLAAETFSGEARIRVRVLQPTERLVLNAAELTTDGAR
jgi:aminopeptidase N